MKKKIVLLVMLSTMTLYTTNAQAQKEKFYSDAWCNANKGLSKRKDVALSDGTFPDCITATHVVEFDFSKGTKHYEGLGQAIHYTNKYNEDNCDKKRKALLILIVDVNKPSSVKRYEMIKHDGSINNPHVEVRMVEK